MEGFYIFWDEVDGERLVYIQCEKCYKENSKGYFWPKNWGYGDDPIVCQCGELIHKGYKKDVKKSS